MLQPFLVVGVGGSGGKTVRALRHTINLTLRRVGWEEGIPDSWQFLHFDSPQAQDGERFPAPFLPIEDYLSLVPGGQKYPGVYELVKSRTESKHFAELARVLPNPADALIDIGIGAGQYRGIGKAIAYGSLDQMFAKAKGSLAKMKSSRALAQLVDIDSKLGGNGVASKTPRLVIVSSIAGGSGAGQFIEVTEAIKSAISLEDDPGWADESVSILYAPDVFASLGAMGGGVASNSLFALSETMNAIWSQSPSPAIASLYRDQGLIVSSAQNYRIGPAYNHIIGRASSSVTLADPEEVYKATGDFMATWITNPSLQDELNGFYFGNWMNRATLISDNTGVKASLQQTPFSSFGYGKVTLGLDQFEDYSAERIAREAIDNLLKRHLASDPGTNQKSEPEWVQDLANKAEADFFGDTRLYKQRGSQWFDFYEDLSPATEDTQGIVAQLSGFLDQQTLQGMPAGGHSPGAWAQIIENGYRNISPQLISQFVAKVAQKAKSDWVPAAPERLQKIVGKSLSQNGLPVTVELLERLIQKSKETSAFVKGEASKYRQAEMSLTSRLSASMAPAQMMPKVPQQNPAVTSSSAVAVEILSNVFYAAIYEAGAALIEDFASNYLAPLLQSLVAMGNKLSEAVKDGKLPDGRPNPYLEWAGANQQTPSRYRPAPNVSLLIDHEDYPETFNGLLRDTFKISPNPEQELLDELFQGSQNVKDASVRPGFEWSVFETMKVWVPLDRSFQAVTSSPQKASFRVYEGVMAFYDAATNWIEVDGRPFRSFCNQNLADYLEAYSDPILQGRRNSDFVAGFSKAVASSDPMVILNDSLLQATHNIASSDVLTFLSDIPVSPGGPLFDQLKSVMQNFGIWRDSGTNGKASESAFKGPNAAGASTTSEVFITKLLSNPVQPLVMGSVVSPIASQWLKSSVNPESRLKFMQWKLGRGLSESIPASTDKWNQMLTGWHFARALNLLNLDMGDRAAFNEKGPKLSIWIDGGLNYVDFPHPMFSEKPATMQDYPATVLQSLKVALLNCYAAGSLKPLEPYKKLEQLGQGSSGTDVAAELADWVQSARLEQGQPHPEASRAGSPSDTPGTRSELIASFLKEELEAFLTEMADLDKFAASSTYPLIWEIRREVEASYKEAIRIVTSIKLERKFS